MRKMKSHLYEIALDSGYDYQEAKYAHKAITLSIGALSKHYSLSSESYSSLGHHDYTFRHDLNGRLINVREVT